MFQKLKNLLVKLGPGNPAVRAALALHARQRGFRLSFSGGKIRIGRDTRRLAVGARQFTLVPFLIDHFEEYFETVEPDRADGCEALDFSGPAFHRYKRLGVGFYSPGFPEEDSLEAYVKWYRPAPGDLVFDAGAYAGLTTYMLSKAVGPAGRVIAFEPGREAYACLLKNIELHKLSNVTAVPKAMAGSAGRVRFTMDDTTAAGFSECLPYPDAGPQMMVETISFADACRDFGVPRFMKMDIEGAEVEVIRAALPVLSDHPVHLALETEHRLPDGGYTWKPVEELLRSIGYTVDSSTEAGQMFTWARPRPSAAARR